LLAHFAIKHVIINIVSLLNKLITKDKFLEETKMTKHEWETLRENLISLIQNFELSYGEDNCIFKLDRDAEDPDNCIVSPSGYKYKGFYTFTNSFFYIYVDGWYHNYYGREDTPAWRTDFPRGYKSGLTKLIKDFCAEHNLYCELRKAFRYTCNPGANTCAFIIALNK
jgi:hypothetical protein